jgi:predicted transcriptional regulator
VNKLANLNFRFGNFVRILKSTPREKKPLRFQSLLTGEDLTLDVCSFEEILPYSLMSIPISTVTPNDNVWIATSMLSRISDVTNNVVVVEDGFPIGTISVHEILDGLRKNPTTRYFEEGVTNIMNADFYIDSRNTNVASVLKRISRAKNPFTVIENDKTNFSQFSIRQVLEIGSLCKTNITVSSFPKKHTSPFRRDDQIIDVIEKLERDESKFVLLEDEFTFVNHEVLLEKIKEVNTTQCDNLLGLSASTLKTMTPTLISERLTISEICKIMLNMKYPCVMTSEQLITPYDILNLLSKEI